MSTATEKLRYLIEVVGGKQAAAELTGVGSAATTTGTKMGGLKSTLMGSAGLLAGLAGVAAVGKKAIDSFQNLALESGRFAEATGLSAEQSSRWIEVAGDLGVSAGSLETAIGRMAKTLGATPEKFDKYGVAVQRAEDGTTDINATFLALIDRLNAIKDPAERARVASELLGRGWQDLAEVIGKGSADLKGALADVSDQKIINDEEVRRAREFRATMDELSDAVQDLSIEAGEVLVPIIGDLAEVLAAAADKADPLIKLIGALQKGVPDQKQGDWTKRWSMGLPLVEQTMEMWDKGVDTMRGIEEGAADASDEVAKFTSLVGKSSVATSESSTAQSEASDELARMSDELKGTAAGYAEAAAKVEAWNDAQAESVAADNLRRIEAAARAAAGEIAAVDEAWQGMTDALEGETSWLDIQDAFAGFVEEMAAFAEIENKTEQDWRNQRRAVIELKQAVAEYAQEVGDIPPSQVTTINAMIDAGSIAEVEQMLAILTRNRAINVDIRARGGIGYGNRTGRYTDPEAVGATGGIVNRPTVTLIGEAGPEAVVPLSKSPGNGPLPAMTGGGNTFNFNVTVGDEDLLAAINRWARRNGRTIPGITTVA